MKIMQVIDHLVLGANIVNSLLIMGFGSCSNLVVATSPISSSMIKAMYVLGDSSVDCGENTLLYPLLHHNLSLYPCNDSHSSLLPHLLAKKVGLPFTTPFYSQNGSTEVLLHGVNCGSIGATIMVDPRKPSHQSLNQQLRQASEIVEQLRLQLGEEKADSFIQSSTLFYLSFGKDDYIDHFIDKSNTQTSAEHNGKSIAHILVDQMANAIRDLYEANVRKILYMGILPLGCTPHVVWQRSKYLKGNCEHKFNKLVLEYNTLLEQQIINLNLELSDAQIIFCDVYRVIMKVIAHPQAYGFENVSSACCGLGGYGGMSGCLSMDIACQRASTYVWWDLFNPAKAVNSLIVDSAWSGQPIPNVCRPITVQKLVSSSK